MSGLRDTARDLFAAACAAADPAHALTSALVASPLPRPDPGGVYRVVAVGKAAIPMAACLLDQLDGAPAEVIVVTNYENARDLPGATVLASGHPVPDENGLAAADRVEGMLRAATPADRVIALISGGGSALLPAPIAGLSLDEKAELNRILLANGFEITEINLIRQQVSRLKGGGFLRATAAPLTAYILSDVIGDDLRVIASGPTVAPIGTRAQARALLRSKGLWESIPSAARAILERDAPSAQVPEARNLLVGSNRKSLNAVAVAAGPEAQIVNDRLTGDVAQAAKEIVNAARNAAADRNLCLVFGGETTVTLRGNGVGGRNQELALRVALAMPELQREWVFLSGGTDGRDGPTDAAGGIVDGGTIARIRHSGGDPDALLANNDSHAALELSGDLLITGATGTNVADVQLLLLRPVFRPSAKPRGDRR
ncbi:glycerate kinase type-2 family protein [Albidovulum sp.]|uniref:glycerate kinase type-2 family protein n=1 Tax=Albidovulum sp. TaxID=1872424 RepID=UPI0035281A7C